MPTRGVPIWVTVRGKVEAEGLLRKGDPDKNSIGDRRAARERWGKCLYI